MCDDVVESFNRDAAKQNCCCWLHKYAFICIIKKNIKEKENKMKFIIKIMFVLIL